MHLKKLLSLGVAVASAGAVQAQSATAMPKLDLNRLATGWYEIARLPNRPEKRCVSDAMQIYALGNKPGRLQVVESCLLKDGESNIRNLSGKQDKHGDGKLKLGSSFLFTKKVWVLATGPNFEWALVGSPNHKLLWVLSRKAQMDAADLQQIEGIAANQGYKTGKLETVVQGK